MKSLKNYKFSKLIKAKKKKKIAITRIKIKFDRKKTHTGWNYKRKHKNS
jgi:hypothetical protein